MGKCLVTKLNGSVSNMYIPKIGEMKLSFPKGDNQTQYTRDVSITLGVDSKVRVVGGYFTDATLTNNLGTELNAVAGTPLKMILSNTDCTVFVGNKYSLVKIDGSNWDGSKVVPTVLGFSLDELSYSNVIQNLALTQSKIYGDISALKNASSLLMLNLNDNPNITGDISALANKPNLVNIYLMNTGTFGNLENLVSNNLLKYISVGNGLVTGDISKMQASFNHISCGNNCNFTWKGERSSTSPIISITGKAANFGDDLDAMLINQAKCAASTTDSKLILVKGNKTSASDNAVSELQSKGYTVTINV